MAAIDLILGPYAESTLTDAEKLWVMLERGTINSAIKLQNAGANTEGLAKIASEYLYHLRQRQEYKQKGLIYCCGLQPVKPTLILNFTDITRNSITVVVSGGVPPYSYSWGEVCCSNQTTATAINLVAGLTCTVTVEDDVGNIATG